MYRSPKPPLWHQQGTGIGTGELHRHTHRHLSSPQSIRDVELTLSLRYSGHNLRARSVYKLYNGQGGRSGRRKDGSCRSHVSAIKQAPAPTFTNDSLVRHDTYKLNRSQNNKDSELCLSRKSFHCPSRPQPLSQDEVWFPLALSETGHP